HHLELQDRRDYATVADRARQDMLVRLSPGSCAIWRPETQNSAFLLYPLHGRFLQDPTSPLVQRSSEVQNPLQVPVFQEQSCCVIIPRVKKHQTQLHSTQSWSATGLRGRKIIKIS
ncbi:hypothetical protein TNCV_2782811, partial [Trichonephila clavipes]